MKSSRSDSWRAWWAKDMYGGGGLDVIWHRHRQTHTQRHTYTGTDTYTGTATEDCNRHRYHAVMFVLLPRYIIPTCACAPVVQVRIESAPTCRKYPAALRQPLPAPPIPQSFLSIVPTPGHYLRQSRPCFPRHQRWKPGQDLRPSQRPAQRHSRCRE